MKIDYNRREILLGVSYLLQVVSLINGRGKKLMSLSILIKMLATLLIYRGERSKKILISLLLQVTSFLTVFIGGSIFTNNYIPTYEVILMQTIPLQISYILMGFSDLYFVESKRKLFYCKNI